jgi:large repetitive protein
MSFARWLAKYFPEQFASRRSGRRRAYRKQVRPRQSRPRLESLEDRLAPATLTVNSTADSITLTTALTLREAMTLIDNAGNPNSLGQASYPAGWVSQINTTNAFGTGDTILFAPLVFTGTQTITLVPSLGELPQITVPMIITGPTTSTLNLSGGNASRIFDIPAGATTVFISNLTIEKGSVTSGGGPRGGGGILNVATLNLDNCIVTGNASSNIGGGGIYNAGNLNATSCTIKGNAATSGVLAAPGGGLDNPGQASLTSCTISGNSAAQGGGIYNTGVLSVVASTLDSNAGAAIEQNNSGASATITSSTITNSTGAGIVNAPTLIGGGSMNVNGCTIAGNTASAISGGGLSNGSKGSLTLIDSAVTSNTTSLYGGGVFNSGTLVVTDSTLYGNTAKYGGGGIFTGSAGSSATITDATIAGNTTTSVSLKARGGGIGLTTTAGTITIGNSIVANNKVSSSDPDVFATVTSSGYNIVGNATGAIGFTGTGDQPNVNPDLSILGYYGGPTQTLALIAGSPALGAGNAADVNLQDQRGFSRQVGGTVDIGAFETQQLPYDVNTNQDTATGAEASGQLSLRDALQLANALLPAAGAAVSFDPSLNGATITLAGVELPRIKGSVNINSGGALTISGAGVSRIFDISTTATVTLTSLTITKGASTFSGGAIANAGALTLQSSTVTNSTVNSTVPKTGGGGIFNYGTLQLLNSTVSHNSATMGGGGIFNGNSVNSGTVYVKNSKIYSNKAAYGAGLFNFGSSTNLVSSTISTNTGGGLDNSANSMSVSASWIYSNTNNTGGGGGVSNYGSSLSVTDSTISGNKTAYSGGGIASYVGSTTLTDDTIANNTAGGTPHAGGVSGGGGVASTAAITLNRSTVSGNTASSGLGGGTYTSAYQSYFAETLISGNTNTGKPDFAGVGRSHGYNLIGTSAGTSQFTSKPSDLIGTPGLTGSLGNYGAGTLPTVPLLPGSPAIDAGNPADTNADERGTAVQNGRKDIGAFESQGFTITVTSGDNQQTLVSTAFAPLDVTVHANQAVEPVAGGQVTFSSPLSGASTVLTSYAATIGAGGKASYTPTANSTVGTYVVTASSTGTASSGNFHLLNYQWAPITLPATTVGVAYNATISAQIPGATTNYVVTGGSIPSGITFTKGSNKLAITGTPTASGTVTFTVTETDSDGAVNNSYTLLVNPAIVLIPAAILQDTVGFTRDQAISPETGTGTGAITVAYTVTSGAIPPGVNISTLGSSVYIKGAPSTVGSVTFTVTATDSVGAVTKTAYTLVVNPPITLNPSSGNFVSTIGVPLNQVIDTVPGTGTPVPSETVTSGTLPQGLNFVNSPGAVTISGTPTTTGTVAFQVKAIDDVGSTVTENYTLTINPGLVLSPATLPSAAQGQSYSQQITATGGTGPHSASYTVTSVTQPASLGFTIDTTGGVLSITASNPSLGTVTFNATFTDVAGATATGSYTLSVRPYVAISPNSIPQGTVGTFYDAVITGSGGVGTITLASIVAGGMLPAGLSLVTSGNTVTISGTPAAAGSVTIVVTGVDTSGDTGARVYPLTVNPAIQVFPGTLPGGTVAVAYNKPLFILGGSPTNVGGTLTYSITATVLAGALPSGMTLTTGPNQVSLAGTPTSAGFFSVQVTAADSAGAVTTVVYPITISPPVTLTPAPLAQDTVGIPESLTISALGGTGSKTITTTTVGAVPTGVHVALGTNSVTITGTPSAAGSFTLNVTATDTIGAQATQSYTVVVNPVPRLNLAQVLGPSVAERAYNQTVNVVGGTGISTVTVTPVGGAIPTGLSINGGAGQFSITGTPLFAGSVTLRVVITDALGVTTTETVTFTVDPQVTVAPVGLPAGTADAAYYQTIGATGGYGNKSLTYNVTSGKIPNGLLINSDLNVLSLTNTPAAPGVVSFEVTATDALGDSSVRSFTLKINPPIMLSVGSIPASTVGVPYSASITASGGTGALALVYRVTAGALPAGLTFTPTPGGLTVSGTPLLAGVVNFKVTAYDSVGAAVTTTYSLRINPGVVFGQTSLPQDTVGMPYSATISAGLGTGVKTLSYTGTLPGGMSIMPTTNALVLTGTPMAIGRFVLQVTATDAVGATRMENLVLTVNPPISFNRSVLPAAALGVAYEQVVVANGGTGNKLLGFGVVSGAVPAGLTIVSVPNGLIVVGTARSRGTVVIRVVARDVAGAVASELITLVVS